MLAFCFTVLEGRAVYRQYAFLATTFSEHF